MVLLFTVPGSRWSNLLLSAAAPSLPASSPKLPLAECPSNTPAYAASFAAASTNAYAATGSAPPVPAR